MRRNYAASLRSSSAMSDPQERLSDADARLARSETLLREANRDRLAEMQEDIVRRRAILEKAAKEHAINDGAGHGIHYIRVLSDKEGEFKFETIIVKAASPEIEQLMLNPAPLMTGLIWEGMSMPERAAMLTHMDLSPDLVFAESVLPMLPDESKSYLLAWQKQINSGAAWSGSLSVGKRASDLIEKGYLLYGKELFSNEYCEQPARSDLAGRAGSASYVRAIMGRLYIEWLLANEEHPIEA